jgi:hypothetical protein
MNNVTILLQSPSSGSCLYSETNKAMYHSVQGPSIHCREVVMSGLGFTSASYERLHKTGELWAQPESGTSIVVNLHKTVNLKPNNGIPGCILAYGVSFAQGIIHHHCTTLLRNTSPEHTAETYVYCTVKLRRIPSDLLDHLDLCPKSATTLHFGRGLYNTEATVRSWIALHNASIYLRNDTSMRDVTPGNRWCRSHSILMEILRVPWTF